MISPIIVARFKIKQLFAKKKSPQNNTFDVGDLKPKPLTLDIKSDDSNAMRNYVHWLSNTY